jgi:hypothetical protein
LNTHNVHNAREIVGEHVQRHLGSYLRQALHQKVRCAHAHLERRERMLRRLASLAHRLRILVQTLLNGFEHMLVLPSGNAPYGRILVRDGANVGWINYMLKDRQKSEFDGFLDCIIIESLHNPIADA